MSTGCLLVQLFIVFVASVCAKFWIFSDRNYISNQLLHGTFHLQYNQFTVVGEVLKLVSANIVMTCTFLTLNGIAVCCLLQMTLDLLCLLRQEQVYYLKNVKAKLGSSKSQTNGDF